MSLSDLIQFPYIPQELYEEYKSNHNVTVKDLDSLKKELIKLFKLSKKGDRLSQLILFDFYLSINHKSVFKDNITGKRIEQKLSKLFALSTGDEIKKENPEISKLLSKKEIALFDETVLSLVCSNYRQKGDLFFFNSTTDSIYKLSIKSLVPTNTEINFGAFEFQSTVKGIEGLEALQNLQERDRPIDLEINGVKTSGVGLGSSKQLSKAIEYIKSKGKLDEYLTRFKILLKGVFKDDFLIYIKENNKFSIYLLDNAAFIDIVLKKVKNGFVRMRVEGNAFRIDDLDLFKTNSVVKFEYAHDEVLPEYDEIERLIISSNHDKLVAFRNFIRST